MQMPKSSPTSCLHFFHFSLFILHKNFPVLINFFCQIIFHSFACVAHAKRINLEDLVFTWNHESK